MQPDSLNCYIVHVLEFKFTKMFTETKLKIGNAKKGKWSGTFLSSEESTKAKKHGRMIGLMNLSSPEEFDSELAGDLLLENMQDAFYEQREEGNNCIVSLEKAILSTARKLEFLLQREKVAAEEGIDLNVTAIVVQDSFIYMAVLGEGNIFVFRNDRVINITKGLKDLSGRELIKSGSGRISSNDVFILLSPFASVEVSESDIRKAIDGFDLAVFDEMQSNPLFGMIFIKMLDSKSQVDNDKALDLNSRSPNLEEAGSQGTSKDEPEKSVGGHRENDMVKKSDKDDEEDHTQDKENNEEAREKKENENEEKSKISQIRNNIQNNEKYKLAKEKGKEYLFKARDLFKKYVWDGLMGMKQDSMYVKGAGPKKNIRGIVILIVLVASLLFLSIRSIKHHGEVSNEKGNIEKVLSEVDEEFKNGKNLGEAGDIKESVKILEKAMDKLKGIKDKGIMEEEISTKIDEGEKLLIEVRKIVYFTQDDLLSDIGGYIDGGKGDDFTLVGNNLYITDKTNGAIYSLNIEGGEVDTVISEDFVLTSPQYIVSDKEEDLIILDKDKGLLKYSFDDKKLEELVGLSASSIGEVSEMENYITPDGQVEFIYILKPNEKEVRKISKYGTGYSLPTVRLSDGVPPGGTDIEIDGKIYLISKNGNLSRFFGESLDPYTLVGLDKNISKSSSLELDDQLVFVSDIGNERIVVVTKGNTLAPQQGKFVAQFMFEGEGNYFENIKDIYVDNSQRVIYVLAGSKIFSKDLTKVDSYAEKLL